MNVASRGAVKRFVQIGKTSIVVCAFTAALVAGMAVMLHLTILIVGFVIVLLCGVLCSTLTIEVDDDGLFWCFTGGLFSRRVSFADIAAFEATRWQHVTFGYRVGFNTRAWIVSGRSAIGVQMSDSAMQYIVGCDDPGAVVAEIERRKAARADR